jgi:CMP-N,N'-diacetyllegionaminic acid synthase
MRDAQTITAIIPARAGSKGIPGKNLWTYDGVSLLARAIRLGLHCSRVGRVIVSTDSEVMRAIALQEGAECPALRPAHLASDVATSVDVVKHVIAESAVASDHLLLLQVTSPLRTLADCNEFLTQYLSSAAPAAASVTRHHEPHPAKMLRLEAGHLKPFLDRAFEGPRQALPPVHALNGAFYAIQRDVFLAQDKFLPEGSVGYEMPPERSHNLDAAQDLQVLQAMLDHGFWVLESLAKSK